MSSEEIIYPSIDDTEFNKKFNLIHYLVNINMNEIHIF